jgi:cell shape-determining protein MreD
MSNRFFGGLSRKDRFRIFMRWFFYSSALLIFYMVMAGGWFRGWQPILIIPLAVAVAMREREFAASVFGAVCGLVIDIACGRIFGFTGIWLLPSCLGASLLVSHLIKVNLLNFLWLNAVVCALAAFADYLFRYVLFRVPNAHLHFTDFILPAHLSAAVLSPLIYLLVKAISIKMSLHERIRLSSSHDDDDDEER